MPTLHSKPPAGPSLRAEPPGRDFRYQAKHHAVGGSDQLLAAVAGDLKAIKARWACPGDPGIIWCEDRSVSISAEIGATVDALRAQVAELHAELPKNLLVVWTAGNVSARVPGRELLVIKPSGLGYDQLTPQSMVVTDFDGILVEGERAPSSDAAAHAYVYRHMEHVGGVVHTHSTYACAWAALRRPVPCVLTMMADEFGGDIPIGPFELIGDDSIGRGIVETLRHSRSRAVLMANHGPFTVGRDARDAVKAAVMCEDVCRSVFLACQLGDPVPIAQADIDSLYARYQNVYGQP